MTINEAQKLTGIRRWTVALAFMGSVFILLQLNANVTEEFSKKYQAIITITRPLFKGTKPPSNDDKTTKKIESTTTPVTFPTLTPTTAAAPLQKTAHLQKTTHPQSTTITIKNDIVETTETTPETTKTTTIKTTTAPEINRFPTIDGMYSMDKYLKLPEPVPLRPYSKEPILGYSQKRDYPVLNSQPYKCGSGKTKPVDLSLKDFDFKNDIFLLMAVKSSCAMWDRRDAVRKTWGNETWARDKLQVNTRLVFLLGRCPGSVQANRVNDESRKYDDILQWDFHDSFRNLTLKEVLFLQWVTKSCQNVPFIFKGDDDVFVNTRNLINYLRGEVKPEDRRNLFVGSRLQGSPRILDPTWKYYVSYNLYPDKYYPPYVSGGGFLMSSDLAVRLFQASLRMRIFPIDDAFVGTLLKQAGVDPKNDRRFKSWGIKTPTACHLSKVFTFHKSLPSMLLRQWKGVIELDESQCDDYNVMASQTQR